MIFKKTKLLGLYIIEPSLDVDKRGYFARIFCKKELNKANLGFDIVQINKSLTKKKGTIRGLHFQKKPKAEAKIVQCVRGSIYDVVVDLRKGSPTFGQWDSVFLSENLYNYAFVPRGFGHAICTLTEECEVIYKVDNYYSPEYEVGLLWNDPDLNIDWPTDKPILSEKDRNNMTFKEFINKYGEIEI